MTGKDEDNEDYEEINIESSDEDEEVEIEITEASLTEDEIDYWISELGELKKNKSGQATLPLDDENELLINYDGGSDSGEDGGARSRAVIEYEEVDDEEDEDNEDESEDGDEAEAG